MSKIKKEVVLRKVEVIYPQGIIQILHVSRIMEGNKQISPDENMRSVLSPGDSLRGVDPDIADIAKAVWIPSRVKAFQALRKAAGLKT